MYPCTSASARNPLLSLSIIHIFSKDSGQTSPPQGSLPDSQCHPLIPACLVIWGASPF